MVALIDQHQVPVEEIAAPQDRAWRLLEELDDIEKENLAGNLDAQAIRVDIAFRPRA
ncbi:MAG: hypothetical protein ACYCUM_05490 [Solirubrobacteraceae bacterium]